jgi:hypothetical protein
VNKEAFPANGGTDRQGIVWNLTDSPLTRSYASTFVHLLPFIEQSALYQQFTFDTTESTGGVTSITTTTTTAGDPPVITAGVAAWNIISPDGETADALATRKDTIAKAKIPILVCPSTNNSASKSGSNGFVASYVGVGGGTAYQSNKTALIGSNTLYPTGGTLSVTAGTAPNTTVTTEAAAFTSVTLQNGALPVGKRGSLKIPDGTSNTLVTGEISWNVGESTITSGAASGQLGAWYQGAVISDSAVTSYYSKVVTPFDTIKGSSLKKVTLTGTTTDTGTGAIIITTKKQQVSGSDYTKASNAGSWGSNHPGVAIFGLGDGSEQWFTGSVADNIICNLAVVDDGVAVGLP